MILLQIIDQRFSHFHSISCIDFIICVILNIFTDLNLAIFGFVSELFDSADIVFMFINISYHIAIS